MTRAEADAECSERNAAPGAPAGVRWLAREASPGDWDVVRVVIPGLGASRIGPLKTTTGSGRVPDPRDNPRPLHNPLWGGP